MRYLPFLLAVLTALTLITNTHAAPVAEQFMLEGKLAEGEKELLKHLEKNPKDDEARFGLGAIQFLLTFEHLGTSLYKHGLRTERAFPGMAREVREILPQNPDPKPISYDDARQIVQTLISDLEKAEATLAQVEDESVKLPMHVGLIKIDLFGLGKPVNAAFVMGEIEADLPEDPVRSFVIGFDRGDVNWLRGYCHFLCAVGEVLLAVDGEEAFHCTAHLFFEKVDTPHKFLVEEDRNFERAMRWGRGPDLRHHRLHPPAAVPNGRAGANGSGPRPPAGDGRQLARDVDALPGGDGRRQRMDPQPAAKGRDAGQSHRRDGGHLAEDRRRGGAGSRRREADPLLGAAPTPSGA